MRPQVLLLSLLTSSLLLASTFKGVGYAPNIKDAKYEALVDLSMSIKAEVESEVQSSIKVEEGVVISSSQQHLKISTKLPIIGAEYKVKEISIGQVRAEVYLSSEKVKSIYKQKLVSINSEITSLMKQLPRSKDNSEKVELYQAILLRLDVFERYESVALILDVKDIVKTTVNRAEVESALFELSQNIDTIGQGVTLLNAPFLQYKNIFIYPPLQVQSHEVTPFSQAIKIRMKSMLNNTSNLSDAKYLLIGEYIESAKGVLLNYKLISKETQEDVISSLVTFQPKAYANLRVKPNSLSFDKLLHDGVVVSSSFKVAIATNKGKEALLFNEGESIEIMVKLNKMGYFYVVGFTEETKKRFAYLLELREAPGDSKFQFFVNADDVNRWISLGAFDVAKPFGVESLQVMAATKSIGQLPEHYYDNKSGYYMIGSTPEETVVKTRGLKRKKRLGVEKVEAVLMFTTMPK